MRRKNFINRTALCAMLIFALGCEKLDEGDELGVDKLLIVEGYVYAGEPIKHLKLSKIHSGGSAIPVPVSDAQVEILQGSARFELHMNDSVPGLYYQEDASTLPSGEGRLTLNVKYGGRTYQASTKMPSEITGLGISTSDIHLQPGNESSVLAQLYWDDVAEGSYCIFIRNISPDAWPIGTAWQPGGQNPFYQVVTSSSIDLMGAHFSHYGTYEIYVTAVNQEYADLFVGSDRLSMTAAPSNITNGFGVFTAFNGQAVVVHVQ